MNFRRHFETLVIFWMVRGNDFVVKLLVRHPRPTNLIAEERSARAKARNEEYYKRHMPDKVKRAQHRRHMIHGLRYTLSVIQIRYRGYKGVLMVNPGRKMDENVHFQKSMRKFTDCPNDILSILKYFKSYTFGKLNDELMTLLYSLGVSDDIFLHKQREYFNMIIQALKDPVKTFIFLSYMGDQNSANDIVLNDLESAKNTLERV